MTLEADGGGKAQPAAPEDVNAYTVGVTEDPGGWQVHIVGPGGSVAWTRHCADAAEARTFASTIQQHIYWLSPVKFREYYRLDSPA